MLVQLELIARDLHHGFRGLWRSPQLASAVVLTFVIGLGLCCAVFSLLNGLFYRAQVSQDPASFVQIYATSSGDRRPDVAGTPFAVTLEYFDAARTRTRTLSALTVSKWARFRLGGSDSAYLRGQFVSCNYMAAHMRPVMLGRAFVDDDCAAPRARAPVAVLSERGWSTRFGRDPSVLGRALRLNGQDVMVVGVSRNELVGDPVAPMIFLPYTVQSLLEPSENYFRAPSQYAWLNLTGRLAPGKTVREAQAELQVISTAVDRLHPGTMTTIVATDGAAASQPSAGRHLPLILALSFGSTLLVLLLVCATVATLLLARATSRRQEMAVRLSLGASRARLVRQLLTEGVGLALTAAVLSVGLATYLPGVLAQSMTELPVAASLGPDWRVVGYAVGLAVCAGCAAALAPALESLRFEQRGTMRAPGPGQRHHASTDVCGALLSAQIAICLALLVATGLIARAHHRLLRPDLGYDPEAVLVASLDLGRLGYSPSGARALSNQLRPRLDAMPGVEAVAFSSAAPFRGDPRVLIRLDGGHDPIFASLRAVSAAYFRVTGVRLIRGRLFPDRNVLSDGGVIQAVLSESLESRLAPTLDSLGRRIRVGREVTAEIVGIVEDTGSVRPGERDGPTLYMPMQVSNVASRSVLVQFTGDARPLMAAIRAEARILDPQLAVAPETVSAAITRAADQHAIVVWLAAIPSGLAIFLSVVGVAGVAAFGAAQRNHEIGVRTALGANPSQIVTLVAGSLRKPLIVGLLSGVLLATFVALLLQRSSLLGNVEALDPIAYGGAFLLLASMAAVAAIVPTLRAARQDSWRTLMDD